MKLTKNMRVSRYGDVEAEQFADHLLGLGSGNCPKCKEPDSIFVENFVSCVTATQERIDAVFPNLSATIQTQSG